MVDQLTTCAVYASVCRQWRMPSCTMPHVASYNGSYCSCSLSYASPFRSYAGYTLCTNVDKSGANHESRIVYTQVIRVRFVPDLISDSRFVNTSSFCTNHQRTRTWFTLICLWCVHLYTLFVHFEGFLVYSGSFSTQVGWLTISWSVCDCSWWFADGCANHEFDEFMNSV